MAPNLHPLSLGGPVTALTDRGQGSVCKDTSGSRKARGFCWRAALPSQRPPWWRGPCKCKSLGDRSSWAWPSSHPTAGPGRWVEKRCCNGSAGSANLGPPRPPPLPPLHPVFSSCGRVGCEAEISKSCCTNLRLTEPVSITEWLLLYASKFWGGLWAVMATRITSSHSVTVGLRWPSVCVESAL